MRRSTEIDAQDRLNHAQKRAKPTRDVEIRPRVITDRLWKTRDCHDLAGSGHVQGAHGASRAANKHTHSG